MTGFDDLFSTLRKFEGLANPMKGYSNIMKAALGTSNFGSIAMLKDITKSVTFDKSQFHGIIDVATGLQASMKIPESTVDAIRSIHQQHLGMTAQWRSVSEAIQQAMGSSQMMSLQKALNSTASQIASLSIDSQNWELLEEFEEITLEAVTLNEKVASQETLTQNELEEIKAFMVRVENMVTFLVKDNQSLKNKILTWMAIISFIFMGKDQASSLQPKPESVTQKDWQAFQKEIVDTIQQGLKEQKEYRVTKRRTKVHHKPKTKSPVLTILPPEFDIYILQRKQEWIYVSFHNPIDNLPETGWVLKKYLDQPK